MTERRRRLWSLIPPRYELARGAAVLALLWLYARPDVVVLAVCSVAPFVVLALGG